MQIFLHFIRIKMVADSSLAQLVLGKKAIEYNYIIEYVPMFIRVPKAYKIL